MDALLYDYALQLEVNTLGTEEEMAKAGILYRAQRRSTRAAARLVALTNEHGVPVDN